MSEPRAASELLVRVLGVADRDHIEALLDTDPGYSLFLRANLNHLARSTGLARYWGAFDGSRLLGVAMDLSGRAALFAAPDFDLQPLARRLTPSLTFTMGRPDLVDALLNELPAGGQIQRDEHMFAALDAPPVSSQRAAPAGSVVRRATLLDVAPLTELYLGSDGFENADVSAVRRTIAGRVRSLRTFLAESYGRVAAAASSTGETPFAAMVGGVWTAPWARNRGFAGEVVAALTGELVSAGMRPYLFYAEENATASRLYARLGYRVIGRWSVANVAPPLSPEWEE